jgi:hypothetical protein
MPAEASPLQRWILESQQELLRRLVALEALRNSHRLSGGSLLDK